MIQRAQLQPEPTTEEPVTNVAAVPAFRSAMVTFSLVVITSLVLIVCYGILKPFASVICWAVALTVVSIPLFNRVHRTVNNSDVSAGLTVLFLALGLLIPVTMVVRETVSQVATSEAVVPPEIKSGRLHALIDSSPKFASSVKWMEETFDFRQRSKELSESIGKSTAAIFTGSVWSLTQLILVFFTIYFLHRDRRRILRFVRELIPLPSDEVDTVFRRIAETIHATLYGSLLIAAIQGGLGGLMFWWLGLPAPFLWGTVMTFLSLLPYLGAFLVWLPASLYLFTHGEEQKSLILALWGLLPISMMDNILFPIFIGKRLRFHTLAVFFFILGGVAFFGFAGIVLGPVTLAVADALFDIWRKRLATGEREAAAAR